MANNVVTQSTPLTETQKVQIRRLCGYPVKGSNAATANSNMWWYYTNYQQLEYRMEYLQPEEINELVNLLNTCLGLENAFQQITSDLSTEKAGPWTRNKNEIADYQKQFEYWCRYMANQVLGVPYRGAIYPFNQEGAGQSGMRMEV